MSQPTAACIVIGDEILTGKVHDENSHLLAKTLFEKGIRLDRVETLADNIEAIAEAVRRLARLCDYVFTSGGIGPTHDDVTLEAVAVAFERELAYHAPTLESMKAFYEARDGNTQRLNSARRKMALFPVGAEVITDATASGWVPIIKVENVYVLPGVPGLFSALLRRLMSGLEAGTRHHRRVIYTMLAEGEIAETLENEARGHPEVAIGSYPHYEAQDHKVMVTLEGPDEGEIRTLAAKIKTRIDGFFRDSTSEMTRE